MSICADCKQDMKVADGCTYDALKFESLICCRIPIADSEERCKDCGAKRGYHHFGCNLEPCPLCYVKQLIHCSHFNSTTEEAKPIILGKYG